MQTKLCVIETPHDHQKGVSMGIGFLFKSALVLHNAACCGEVSFVIIDLFRKEKESPGV